MKRDDAVHETWLPVKGFEGLYEVSDLGRIRSVERAVPFGSSFRHVKSVVRKQQSDRDGYMTVNTSLGTIKVHRAVAEAFIENPDGKPQVNHINGNKADNSVSNLEWATCVENMSHASRTGLAKHVPVIRDDGKAYRTVTEAARHNNVPISSISGVLSGRQKTAAGHTFVKAVTA